MFREEVLFTVSECKYLLSLVKKWHDSTIVGKTHVIQNNNIRNSKECSISNKEIENLIIPKIKHFDISSLPTQCTIVKYEVGSFFSKHRDTILYQNENNNTTNAVKNARYETQHRKQTLIIQLSDELDYKGGELIIKNKAVSKKIGNTILFDSRLIHEVTELTEGTRYSFVGWITENNKTKQIL